MSNVMRSLMMVGVTVAAAACSPKGATPPPQTANVDALRCDLLPGQTRSSSVFASPDHVTHVARLSKQRRIGNTVVREPAGARVHVIALPGTTAPYLERIAKCQAADGQANSADQSPLAVPGARVHVREARTGFFLDIESPDREAAKEIFVRSERLHLEPDENEGAEPADVVSELGPNGE